MVSPEPESDGEEVIAADTVQIDQITYHKSVNDYPKHLKDKIIFVGTPYYDPDLDPTMIEKEVKACLLLWMASDNPTDPASGWIHRGTEVEWTATVADIMEDFVSDTRTPREADSYRATPI